MSFFGVYFSDICTSGISKFESGYRKQANDCLIFFLSSLSAGIATRCSCKDMLKYNHREVTITKIDAIRMGGREAKTNVFVRGI